MAGNPFHVIKPRPSAHSTLGLTALAESEAESFLPHSGWGPLSPQPCRSSAGRGLAHCPDRTVGKEGTQRTARSFSTWAR